MEGAKDPDEFIIKYGNVRFENLVENAISLVEFKVKMLKNSLNIESTNDKIKFLNEIAKILSNVDNKMEQEVYIDKIAKEYKISKEAIYAEINKLNYSKNRGSKILEKPIGTSYVTTKLRDDDIPKSIIEREELVIALLINYEDKAYAKIKDKISSDDFKSEKNKKIIQKLYEELEKGNSNISEENLRSKSKLVTEGKGKKNDVINAVIGYFEQDEEIIGQITKIMADDYEIKDVNKAITDVLNTYEKDRLIRRRDEIVGMITYADNETELLKELQKINIKLTQL